MFLKSFRLGLEKMSGQRSISTFFKPLEPKRTNSFDDHQDAKKSKLEGKGDKHETENTTPSKKTPSNDCSSDSLSLSPEQKSLIETKRLEAQMKLLNKKSSGLLTNVGLSWFKALQDEFSKDYFIKLGEFVHSERNKHTIFPPASQVFSWSQLCTIKEVKVVILGQDPYHGPNQAHGLCFSVQSGVPPPPSLENMYKELANDIENFKHPHHGNLTGWAKQGVLLLNAVLTVQARNANSHKDRGWEKFTDAVISLLNKKHSGIVFILWGSYAQKKGAHIDQKKHHILKGVHPSPLSAHRGFFGCKHFSKCNELLKKQGRKPIDWTDLPPC